MKLVTSLLVGLVSVSAATKPTWKELFQREYSFEEYLAHHHKTYSIEEYGKRKAIFEKKLQEIRDHNKQNLSWKMGVNQFTDITDEEMTQYKGNKINRAKHLLRQQNPDELNFEVKDIVELPTTVDWRQQGVVTPPKDQGGCGSCWTFAAAETVEAHLAISTGVLVELSEQQLVSCMPNPLECGGTGGCKGATSELAFDYLQGHGIPTEWVYPYLSHNGTEPKCNEDYTPYATISGYSAMLSQSYNVIMSAVATVGPLAISVDASSWSSYESGVYDGCNATNPDIDHAVQLVGYGSDKTLGDYWLVRNSWTPSWGEGGYIRVKRRSDEETHCGLDVNPFDGTACKGDPDTVKVCGTCGMLFDAAYPTDVKLA